MSDQVLTDGWDCYVRVRRGVYARVDRRGRRCGGLSWGFEPRPRWRPAKLCNYVIAVDGLTCPSCGAYDIGYAETGVRSYCYVQSKRGAEYRASQHPSWGRSDD